MRIDFRFHLNHYKSYSRLGIALHRFRKTMLDIEIFDLNRIIDSLTEELSYNSRCISDSLPTYIWNNTTKHHFHSFKNLHIKLYLSYKKKFSGLLHKFNINKAKKIKPINFSCIIKDEHYKFIKQHHKPYTSNNETVISTNISPAEFLNNSKDSLNNTNEK